MAKSQSRGVEVQSFGTLMVFPWEQFFGGNFESENGPDQNLSGDFTFH